ncbi:hypothetical protein [Streptomyces glaucescens]|uniref:Putative membrane protein n=1 Tax=Streptomyces glaucescens TaxID=1907 RepID=A0A089X703_STRGA|nr:hypothetical protein [Streptomyces glaucescens]AIR98943.1 putative membrane protein [Streptomyces glaucescens]
MIDQRRRRPGGDRGTRRRRAGIVGFLGGLAGPVALFGFFPGLPHVIDAGALLVALAVGLAGRWVCRDRVVRGGRKRGGTV